MIFQVWKNKIHPQNHIHPTIAYLILQSFAKKVEVDYFSKFCEKILVDFFQNYAKYY